MSWISKVRKSFLDEEAGEQQGGGLFSDSEEEDEIIDDFLEEDNIIHNVSSEDSDSHPARKEEPKSSPEIQYEPIQRRNSKKERIEKKQKLEEIDWDDDEDDSITTFLESPVVDHRKLRIIPASLRSVIEQEPVIVFRKQSTMAEVYEKKIFVGIDPGIRNLGVSVAVPEERYQKNSTLKIIKDTLQAQFDYDSVNTMLAIACTVDRLMDGVADKFQDYVWHDLVLVIESQYCMIQSKQIAFQRLVLLACRLEMCFLDWCVRKQKGLHIERVNSNKVAGIFLKNRAPLEILKEINQNLGNRKIPRLDWALFEKHIATVHGLHELLNPDAYKNLGKKQKAKKVCCDLANLYRSVSRLDPERNPFKILYANPFFTLPFYRECETDHEADANLTLVTGILQIFARQQSKDIYHVGDSDDE